MGAVLAALFAAGVVVGWVVDSFLGTTPVFVFVGLALGIATACWYAVTEFRKYLKN
jgi:F0F1-type ATP synthase assembly protein I